MFRRFGNLFRGFFGLFISGLERRNPEAILEVEKEHLRRTISNYNQGLASHAGLCERLMSQIRRLEAEHRDLRAKTAANLRVGNREAAGQYALRLVAVQRELSENRAQAFNAEQTYGELLRARDVSIRQARQKIESVERGINDVKIKRATAELTEMAAGMISNIGGSGDTLSRLQAMVEEQRDLAAGRVRVARDSMNMSHVVETEAEQRALAEMALTDFVANEGLTQIAAPTETRMLSDGDAAVMGSTAVNQ